MREQLNLSSQEVLDGDLEAILKVHSMLSFMNDWENLMRSGWKHSHGDIYDAMRKEDNSEDACSALADVWFKLKDERDLCGVGQ